jgi:hypothetical protein
MDFLEKNILMLSFFPLAQNSREPAVYIIDGKGSLSAGPVFEESRQKGL